MDKIQDKETRLRTGSIGHICEAIMRGIRYKTKPLLLALIIIFLPASVSLAKTYRIATVAWIGWSPLHVAAAKGFWKDFGVDVAVHDYNDPIVVLWAMKANRVDLAMDMAGSVAGLFLKGEPILAVAETNWSHGGDKIIIRRGLELDKYQSHPIGVFLNQPSCLYFLGLYLNEQQLRLSDFRIVEINAQDLSAQFIANRLPVIVNYEPWANEAVLQGHGHVAATSADYHGSIPECMWGYKQTIDRMPDKDITNILKGWIKAVNWMKNPANRNEYFSILKQYTFKRESDMDDTDFERMLNLVRIHDASGLMERNKTNGGLMQYLHDLKAFLSDNGRLTRDFAPADIFNNRYIMHALEDEQGEERTQ